MADKRTPKRVLMGSMDGKRPKSVSYTHLDVYKRQFYDNAPAHAPLMIHDVLVKINTAMLSHSLCSPDLVLADFFLF